MKRAVKLIFFSISSILFILVATIPTLAIEGEDTPSIIGPDLDKRIDREVETKPSLDGSQEDESEEDKCVRSECKDGCNHP
jgi:hypothetical protein